MRQDPLSASVKTPTALCFFWYNPGPLFALEAKICHFHQTEKTALGPAKNSSGGACCETDGNCSPWTPMSLLYSILMYGLKLPLALHLCEAQKHVVKFDCFQKSADTAVHLKTRDFNVFSIDSAESREKGLFCLKTLNSGDTFKTSLQTYAEIDTSNVLWL